MDGQKEWECFIPGGLHNIGGMSVCMRSGPLGASHTDGHVISLDGVGFVLFRLTGNIHHSHLSDYCLWIVVQHSKWITYAVTDYRSIQIGVECAWNFILK